jgi:cold shock CspA family protein
MKGTVEFFHNVRGVGFINISGRRYFVHQNDILMSGFRTLLPGWEVEFEGKQSDKGLVAKKVRPPEGFQGLRKQQKEGAPVLLGGVVRMAVDRSPDGIFHCSFPEIQQKTTKWVSAENFTACYTGQVVVGKIHEMAITLPPREMTGGERVMVLLDQDKNPRKVDESGEYNHVALGSYVVAASPDGRVGIWCIGRRYQPFSAENGENWLVVEQRWQGKVAPSINPNIVRNELAQHSSGLKRDNDGFARGIARAFELLPPMQ